MHNKPFQISNRVDVTEPDPNPSIISKYLALICRNPVDPTGRDFYPCSDRWFCERSRGLFSMPLIRYLHPTWLSRASSSWLGKRATDEARMRRADYSSRACSIFLDFFILVLCNTPRSRVYIVYLVVYIIIIIGGQAAKLRDNLLFLYCFLLLWSCHGSLWQDHRTPWYKVVKFGTLIQDSPISPHSKFEVASPWALAPPTGQSWTCIHVYNFWPIHPIFTNKVSLESLGQAEFNAPYDVILRHDGFSAILVYVKNLQNVSHITHFVQSSPHLAHMLIRPCLTKSIQQIFQIQDSLAATANQIRPRSRQIGNKPISQQPFDIS